jgi:hypothetical protein
MNKSQFSTPILFLIFNRPEITTIVFEEIRKLKPKYLFIAADGHRENIINEAEKCKKTREIVLNGIDWECEVKTLLRNKNLGCAIAVAGAITWFFENIEQGIILEDDCLPHPSFFNYCELLLEKYKYDEKIFAIDGANFQNGKKRGTYSYYFSSYTLTWGWATWRRAWKHFDIDLRDLDNFKKKKIIRNKTVRKHWIPKFEKIKNGDLNVHQAWDYQWLFAMWNHNGVSITPNFNLISNLGFGEDSTHTKVINNNLSYLPTKDIGIITHPKSVVINKKADQYDNENTFKINFTYKIQVLTFLKLLVKSSLNKIKNLIQVVNTFLKSISVY